ncbi:MAG: ABC transporter ATP-binding protein [Pseudomonadota bacterium]
MSAPMLAVEDLSTVFGGKRRFLAKPTPLVRAVSQVSFEVNEGEALGIVGESGCGKSTLAKTILGLIREASGQIRLGGKTVSGLDPKAARAARGDIQYVHQDPGAALDPWWRIGSTLDETLAIHGLDDKAERTRRIDQMLEAVGLDPSMKKRYPHELSGGQQRRVGLARTLALRPKVVILDEPTSGLDLSVQASVLALITSLRQQFGLTVLFISHDLSVVKRMCDRVAVIYLGRIVEIAPTQALFGEPRHPYTRALLASAPRLTKQTHPVSITGDPPSPTTLPPGCAFHTRCPLAMKTCTAAVPPLDAVKDQHKVACLAAVKTDAIPAPITS